MFPGCLQGDSSCDPRCRSTARSGSPCNSTTPTKTPLRSLSTSTTMSTTSSHPTASRSPMRVSVLLFQSPSVQRSPLLHSEQNYLCLTPIDLESTTESIQPRPEGGNQSRSITEAVFTSYLSLHEVSRKLGITQCTLVSILTPAWRGGV